MVEQVEITGIDLRYQGCRMRCRGAEKALLLSILEKGIRDPLCGVDNERSRILLDGFKRYRCAKKLGIGIVPYRSLGSDEVGGIIELIRMSNAATLGICEQARLMDELKSVHHLSVSEIARLVGKSKGWVGMRVGLIDQMSPLVMRSIFGGKFPAYAYMYTLRPFIRMNVVNKKGEKGVTPILIDTALEPLICLHHAKNHSPHYPPIYFITPCSVATTAKTYSRKRWIGFIISSGPEN